MSNSTYNTMWAETNMALHTLLAQETDAEAQPEKDRVKVFKMLATFYVKYIEILHNMEVLYDQMVHPQKRIVIYQVLVGVIGRILELKNEMVQLEYSEFNFFDDVLQDLKLTPDCLEIHIPKCFLMEKVKVVKDRENVLARILSETFPHSVEKKEGIRSMTLEEAIHIIQISERARQGRLRAKFMCDIRTEEKRERLAKLHSDSKWDTEFAATYIQKHWHGYKERKMVKKLREEELMFLGMKPSPDLLKLSDAHIQAEKMASKRRMVQTTHEAEYLKAIPVTKKSLWEQEGTEIKEQMKEQIRQWFIECRNLTGRFPDYPDVEEGGSLKIFTNKTPEEVYAELILKKEEEERKKKEKEMEANKIARPKIVKKAKKSAESVNKKEEESWTMQPSNFLPEVKEGHETYKEIWLIRNETGNFQQMHDVQLIREHVRRDLEEELRIQVDELMRQELKNLKLIIDRDEGTVKKSKKGRKKKGKGRKKKKKKREKDLTPDRTIEGLYQELVEERIIVRPMNIPLSDFKGDYSYLGSVLRQAAIEPMPSLSDVRQLITLYGVLPLASQALHEKGPLVKSILLAGPSGVGKTMLVHALCTETGANLFDLSAQNIVGKYPSKSELKMLVHMVFKVATLLQPSVVWIGDAEKTFYKKVPKNQRELEPKRLKSMFPKFLKSIKPGDRVLVVGTSQRPFDASLKPFCKNYKKIILIPRPDYASRKLFWKSIIEQQGGILTSALDLSSLAKVTDGYTQGHIVTAAQAVLSELRIKHQRKRPLTAIEFMAPLSWQDPVYREEEELFKDWYAKTPMGKMRAQMAIRSKEDGDTKGKGKDKGTDKGRGKTKKKK
ncbi:dynein regulatory complex protein 11 [Callorhinchus milii]|uniref:dynein regulatory complex protein 11 n=1 Tax=Callorhinchus milii TaxID=7868 RepID=UPI001C3FA13C|nr:dynein regulatory complex protein 11 [Callorhinchus milii]